MFFCSQEYHLVAVELVIEDDLPIFATAVGRTKAGKCEVTFQDSRDSTPS